MKHPICDIRERLMALSRLIPRRPHVGFFPLHHHLPFCHNQPCLHSISADILYSGDASCITFSIASHSSPTTAPFLASHLYNPCLISICIEMYYAVYLAAGHPSYGCKIPPPPFARPPLCQTIEHAWLFLSGLETPCT